MSFGQFTIWTSLARRLIEGLILSVPVSVPLPNALPIPSLHSLTMGVSRQAQEQHQRIGGVDDALSHEWE